MDQVIRLLGFRNVAWIVSEGSIIAGERVTGHIAREGRRKIEDGLCDCALVSIHVGGAGLNCQTMNRIVFMDPPTSDVQMRQAKGISSL